MDVIQRFLASARLPVVIEPGQDPIPLVAGAYEVSCDSGRLILQAWTADRNLVRRITGVESESAYSLDLSIERFGKRAGTLQLVDTARPRAETLTRRALRLTFREQFRRSLARQYSGWRIAELSCFPDLEHSLSPAWPRAFLRKGMTGIAAIGAPPSSDPDGALTTGLIWLDYLRRREARVTVEGLTIFLPSRTERTTCHRIRHLDPQAASYTVFTYEDGWEQRIDIADSGNIDTQLLRRDTRPLIPEWLAPIAGIPGVEMVAGAAAVSLRVRGLEFVRIAHGDVRFGLNAKRTASSSHQAEIAALAHELSNARNPGASDRRNPLFTQAPERWLESCIRENLTHIDASLQPSAIYSQAPSITGSERGVIDLVAAGFDGRLAVVEVKASEDLHLPLQALDYWARVRWHLDRGEFTSRGYFQGIPLSPQAPRILLVAPVLQFHPTTETILRFFSPGIDVERIGLAMNWRSGVKVVFRASGAEPGFRKAAATAIR